MVNGTDDLVPCPEIKDLFHYHRPSTIFSEDRSRHDHIVGPESHPFAIRAVGFEERRSAHADKLLYGKFAILADFPVIRHNQALVIVRRDVEVRVPDLHEPIHDLSESALGPGSWMPMPEQDSEWFVFAEIDLNILPAIAVWQPEHCSEQDAEIAKYWDAAAFMVTAHAAEDTVSQRRHDFAEPIDLRLRPEDVVPRASWREGVRCINHITSQKNEAVRLCEHPIPKLSQLMYLRVFVAELHIANGQKFKMRPLCYLAVGELKIDLLRLLAVVNSGQKLYNVRFK